MHPAKALIIKRAADTENIPVILRDNFMPARRLGSPEVALEGILSDLITACCYADFDYELQHGDDAELIINALAAGFKIENLGGNNKGQIKVILY